MKTLVVVFLTEVSIRLYTDRSHLSAMFHVSPDWEQIEWIAETAQNLVYGALSCTCQLRDFGRPVSLSRSIIGETFGVLAAIGSHQRSSFEPKMWLLSRLLSGVRWWCLSCSSLIEVIKYFELRRALSDPVLNPSPPWSSLRTDSLPFVGLLKSTFTQWMIISRIYSIGFRRLKVIYVFVVSSGCHLYRKDMRSHSYSSHLSVGWHLGIGILFYGKTHNPWVKSVKTRIMTEWKLCKKDG